ncbi:motility associated factor glycosyltransferase family protein [Limnochorda pilosa]|uniref:6-hydroxymethylpterin diphosphokinase MptE-like domain-containing protein n=1 Tax=Limnochorda pilosa TaxID=1555112 RepID=A0A0K2SM90_LIMPI|nr:6-hydroxymethylpterin diphosphokinase MptE-like protein [Limnochorda pilosa]BAS28220.1 hypothetical protein LIP_2379 [Limnochorda pilosa]
MSATARETRSPLFEVFPSRAGVPTLRCTLDGDRYWIHSRLDPLGEADILADRWWEGPAFYVVLGLGLGYHVSQLLARMPAERGEILVVEPSAEVFEIAKSSGTLDPLIRSEQVQIAVGNPDALLASLARRPIDVRGEPLKIRVHHVLQRLFPEQYAEYLRLIRAEVNRQAVNAFTMVFWDATWLSNTLANLPYVLEHPPLDVLEGRFKGYPAFIVAAGPSLDKNVGELRRASGKALIIAVGTAVRSLLQAQVTPDLVVTVDGSAKNHLHLKDLDLGGVPVVFDPMVFPAILTHHRGRKFSVKTNNPVYEWLGPVVPPVTSVKAGGSVATVALEIAVRLGCNPLVLVGQDLAYTVEGRTHAQDSIYGGTRLDLRQPGTSYFQVPANDGGEAWTSRSLYSFLAWFERYIMNSPSDKTFINATEGGARIAGTLVATLAETIDAHCTQSVDAPAVINTAHDGWEPPGEFETVWEFLREAVANLRRMEQDTAEAAEVSQRLSDLARQGQFSSKPANRMVKRLGTIDKNLRERDRALHPLVFGAAYRVVTQTLRTSPEVQGLIRSGAAGGDGREASAEAILSVLSQSHDLYQGLHDATERTRKVVEMALSKIPSAR